MKQEHLQHSTSKIEQERKSLQDAPRMVKIHQFRKVDKSGIWVYVLWTKPEDRNLFILERWAHTISMITHVACLASKQLVRTTAHLAKAIVGAWHLVSELVVVLGFVIDMMKGREPNSTYRPNGRHLHYTLCNPLHPYPRP